MMTQKPRKPKRKDTQVPQPSDPSDNVADEVVHKELGDSLVRAATTASSLEVEQDSGNITKTRSKATPNESSTLGTTLGGGIRDKICAYDCYVNIMCCMTVWIGWINKVREKVKTPPNSSPITVIDPNDQPMWSSTRTVAPTPSSAVFQLHIPNNFVIKGTHMQMIQENQFDGRIRSDPHRYVADFLEITNLFQYGENQEEAVKLRTFSFSLTGEAKTWFNELNEGTITTWNEMREAFISQYFSPAKFKRLLNEIHTFHQLAHDTFVEAWLRLKGMLHTC
ncbi:reverse transcriptase domain-containing protein [Tanacetum coccineum]